jgi:hypothetical protein
LVNKKKYNHTVLMSYDKRETAQIFL